MKKFFSSIFLTAAVFIMSDGVYGAGLKINEDGTSEIINDYIAAEENQDISFSAIEEIEPFSDLSLYENESKQGYYYDQLSDIDKYIYDQIDIKMPLLLEGESDVIKINISSKYTIYTTDGYDFFKAPITYIGYDHTEDFWLDTTITCLKGYQTSNKKITNVYYYFGEYSNSTGTTYAPPYETSEMALAEVENVNLKANDILAGISENATRYKKLQIINDWLVDNNSYNPYVAEENDEQANKVAWMLTSALLYGNGDDDTMYPVCEGYAEAFKLMCDSLDIPCVILVSSTHEWNAVQMEDGKWYYVDTTYNDPYIKGDYSDTAIEAIIEEYRYMHFLVGTDNSDISDSAHIVSLSKNLVPPDISESDYVYRNTGDADMDGYLTEADAALMLRHIGGIGKMTSEQSASADINGDGVITLTDVTKLLSKVG